MFTENMMLGAKLASGAGLTIVGMGVVFAVLVLISIALDILRLTSAVQNKNSLGSNAENSVQHVKQSGKQTISAEGDAELIAVMTAAVASSQGMETDRFVITAIRPKNRQSSLWSLAGRQQQMIERLRLFDRKGN